MGDQGLTVFCISWVNPDTRHADKAFESYMREGVEAAIDAIGVATGETEVTAAGYCVGGTLLAVTLAMQAARDLYTRRGEGLSVWIVPSAAIVASDPADKDMMFEPALSKPYRHPTFYDVPDEVGHM